MAKNDVGQAVELTKEILVMIEDESPEVLEQIRTLVLYHMGYNACIYDGNETFKDIICKGK